MGQTLLNPAPPEAENPFPNLLPELPPYLAPLISNLKSDAELGIGRKVTAEMKEAFIRFFVSSGGQFCKSCEHINAAPVEVYRKLAQDKAWQEALTVAKLNMGEAVEGFSYQMALTPKGTVDRMAQLRRFFPSVYRAGDQAPQVAIQVNLGHARQGPAT